MNYYNIIIFNYTSNFKVIETTHDLLKDQKDDQIVDTAFQTLIFWMRMISTNVKNKNINNKFILLKILKKNK